MRALRGIWASPTGRPGMILVVLVVGFAVLGPPLLADPAALHIPDRFASPGWAHWAGTDSLGRDMLARLAAGGRIALGVSLAAIVLALAIGVPLGMLAARARPVVASSVLVLFDVVAAFPSLLFALAAVALLGPGLERLVILVALTLAPGFGRVARAQVLALSSATYLEAARAIGVGPARLWARHVLPNIAGTLLVLASMDIPTVIAIEAGLSFMGVGVPPPSASWGALLYDGYVHLDQSVWPLLGAATMLVLATLGFTLAGEALRDAIDPTLHRAP
ncbi:ABC transporter permease [Rhodovastum atsumiense]|uniref:ABC transporter permease n=1 Tax=Rhodovastum atsumiense TaxID=504468 RepID=A0A5M6IZD0_9PROT|nr:ABC transporter permease [Rhodovastum atsumiense]KAA5613706.1 ABC transporter permease [Rhodovastum atsumiense]